MIRVAQAESLLARRSAAKTGTGAGTGHRRSAMAGGGEGGEPNAFPVAAAWSPADDDRRFRRRPVRSRSGTPGLAAGDPWRRRRDRAGAAVARRGSRDPRGARPRAGSRLGGPRARRRRRSTRSRPRSGCSRTTPISTPAAARSSPIRARSRWTPRSWTAATATPAPSPASPRPATRSPSPAG